MRVSLSLREKTRGGVSPLTKTPTKTPQKGERPWGVLGSRTVYSAKMALGESCGGAVGECPTEFTLAHEQVAHIKGTLERASVTGSAPAEWQRVNDRTFYLSSIGAGDGAGGAAVGDVRVHVAALTAHELSALAQQRSSGRLEVFFQI